MSSHDSDVDAICEFDEGIFRDDPERSQQICDMLQGWTTVLLVSWTTAKQM